MGSYVSSVVFSVIGTNSNSELESVVITVTGSGIVLISVIGTEIGLVSVVTVTVFGSESGIDLIFSVIVLVLIFLIFFSIRSNR